MSFFDEISRARFYETRSGFIHAFMGPLQSLLRKCQHYVLWNKLMNNGYVFFMQATHLLNCLRD